MTNFANNKTYNYEEMSKFGHCFADFDKILTSNMPQITCFGAILSVFSKKKGHFCKIIIF